MVWMASSLRKGVPPSFSRSIKSLLLIRCSLLLAESLASLGDLQVNDLLVLCWFVMVWMARSLLKNYEQLIYGPEVELEIMS